MSGNGVLQGILMIAVRINREQFIQNTVLSFLDVNAAILGSQGDVLLLLCVCVRECALVRVRK